MSENSSNYGERLFIYALLAVGAIVWIGFGGIVFLGILQETRL